jgi:phosphoribosylamine-glycine ligase
MKVLVIGAGGREHAIAWKLSHKPVVPVRPPMEPAVEALLML